MEGDQGFGDQNGSDASADASAKGRGNAGFPHTTSARQRTPMGPDAAPPLPPPLPSGARAGSWPLKSCYLAVNSTVLAGSLPEKAFPGVNTGFL